MSEEYVADFKLKTRVLKSESFHFHECCHCGDQWVCYGIGRSKVCEVDKAVTVNKDGPYCELCRQLTMAHRIAVNRKWIMTAQRIQQALDVCSKL